MVELLLSLCSCHCLKEFEIINYHYCNWLSLIVYHYHKIIYLDLHPLIIPLYTWRMKGQITHLRSLNNGEGWKESTCSLGLPWWSGSQQSFLPMQRVQVGALVRELIIHMQHGIDIKRQYSTVTAIKFWTGISDWAIFELLRWGNLVLIKMIMKLIDIFVCKKTDI